MRITVLAENSAGAAGCCAEHGLSLFIETDRHRILMDTGASDLFLRNAAVLGCDLSGTDAVFISHGHYDHAGGLSAFARLYPSVPVYIHTGAGEAYYSRHEDGLHYIGMEPSAASLPQLRFVSGFLRLDEEISLFDGVPGQRYVFPGNQRMLVKRGNRIEQDGFSHEQYLVLSENGRHYLFSGCAHRGIVNILDAFRSLYGTLPDAVVSGFHFMKRAPYTPEEEALIDDAARELSRLPTRFYTCHCTSPAAFLRMLPLMPGQLQAVSAGTVLTL